MAPFCKDCRFYDDSWGASCHAPALQNPNFVYGAQPSSPAFNRQFASRCGSEGRHFEPRRSLWAGFFKTFRSPPGDRA
jgi:hypothetical protein